QVTLAHPWPWCHSYPDSGKQNRRIRGARPAARGAMDLSSKSMEELLKMQSEAVKHVLSINQAIARKSRERSPTSKAKAKTSPKGHQASLTSLPKDGEIRIETGALKEPLLMKRQMSPGVEGGFGIFASGAMFPDADKIKEKVRASLFEEELNPEDLFKTTGWCQAIARNQLFKNMTMVVIVLNAIWIGIDTDLNTSDLEINSPLIFQVVDNFFCIFFSFEISVRFLAYQKSRDAFKDFSFIFDFSLVLTMIWEVWVTSMLVFLMQRSGGANLSVLRILRLFRLVRIARVGRLMSSCRELIVLVKGISMGLRSVLSTLFLMMVVIYVFAIIFTQLFRGTDEGAGCYDGVLESMNCLMLNVVFPEQQELMHKMLEVGPITYLLGLFYLLITGLTVMNMLIGVLVEVVSVTAQVDKEETAMKAVKEKIEELIPADSRQTGISRELFMKVIMDQGLVQTLSNIDVDVMSVVEYPEIMYHSRNALSVPELVDAILQFRRTTSVSMMDIAQLRRFMVNELEDLRGLIKSNQM
ncbi:L type, partial [Durusdinium trenchii]